MQTKKKIIGSKVRMAREEKRLTISELAIRSNISRITISKIENGMEETPSLETATSIAWTLGKPVEYFYNPNVLTLELTTVPSFRSVTSKTNKDNQETFCKLKGCIHFAEYIYKFINPRALNISQHLLEEAGNITTEKSTDTVDIEALALKLRDEWELGEGPISKLITLLENKGIICCPASLPEKIDSINVSFKVDDSREAALIMYKGNLNYFRQRFSLAHELGHILLHHYWTDIEFKTNGKKAEQQANQFASAFLMPAQRFLSTFIYPSYKTLVALRKIWHVSVSAILRRAYDLKIITEEQYTYLNIEISRKKKGNKTEEPDCLLIQSEQPYYLGNAYSFAFDNNLIKPEDVENFFSLYKNEIVEHIGNQDKFMSIVPDNIYTLR